jgi:hypothetical protein
MAIKLKGNRNLIISSESNPSWNVKHLLKGPGLPRFKTMDLIQTHLVNKTNQGETKIPDDLVFFIDDIDMQSVNISQKLKESYYALHTDYTKMTTGWNEEYTSNEWERIFKYPSSLFM